MTTIVVEGIECENNVRWRLEVKRGRGGAADEWRLLLEGVEHPARAESAAEFLELVCAPPKGPAQDERVVRVVLNLFSRIKAGLAIVPFAGREVGDWSWMRLMGDCR